MQKHTKLQRLTSVGARHSELRKFSNFVHDYATSPRGESLLEEAGLLGTVKRYSVGEHESFMRMASLAGEVYRGRMAAFAIRSAEDNKFVGLVTILPSVELRQSKIPLPGKLMRRLVQPTTDLINNRDNIAAWVDPNRINERDALTEVYTDLGSNALLWTLEANGVSHRSHALFDSGFYPVDTGRFDDQEYGWQITPERTLFLNQSTSAV